MKAGRVRVNGVVADELGVRVDPARDRVELDGEVVTLPPRRWILFHKPAGVLTTRRDPHGGRTVYDALPAELSALRYVGRLDRDTEGLLLLTNDGEAAHALQHPSGEVEREYWAEVEGVVSSGTLERLLRGVELEDGLARPKAVELLLAGRERSTVRLVLAEGRKREVRRLLLEVGHPVVRLRRLRFGPIHLGALPVGAWRELDGRELAALDRLR
jgi:23S rRNA pseudouridine2605 synthase